MIRNLWAFEGSWQITRRIEDRRAGQIGHFEGEAQFQRDETGLLYHESGHLRVSEASAPFKAERQYLWRQEGSVIALYFADGAPFHHFDPALDTPSAHHDCPPDTYSVTYDFTDWPEWESVWTVSGPRKDYTMTSRFTQFSAGTPRT